MNVERILELADLIEKQPHTTEEADDGFSMDWFTHDCGTPSCIGGWAIFLQSRDRKILDVVSESGGKFSEVAASVLGLGEFEASELFFPTIVDMDQITPADAAYTLRHLAKTGEVVWEDHS
jgi:hypothetical protein